jgi:hypothetical protein
LRGHYFPRIQRSNCRRHSASDNIDIVRTEPTRFKSNALSLVAASLCIAIGETSPKTACGKDEDALRDAIVARYQNTVTAREVANKFKTTSRKVREGEDAVRIMLEEAEGRSDPNYDLMVMEAKPEHTQSKFVYRFVSKFAGRVREKLCRDRASEDSDLLPVTQLLHGASPRAGAGMSGDLTVSPNSFGVHRRNSIDSYVGFSVPLARVEDLTCST